MSEQVKAPFRIAIRQEGEWVVGYLADHRTMDGAEELARVRESTLDSTRGPVFAAFRALLEAQVTLVCERLGAPAPSHFGIEAAPEHERAGRA